MKEKNKKIIIIATCICVLLGLIYLIIDGFNNLNNNKNPNINESAEYEYFNSDLYVVPPEVWVGYQLQDNTNLTEKKIKYFSSFYYSDEYIMGYKDLIGKEFVSFNVVDTQGTTQSLNTSKDKIIFFTDMSTNKDIIEDYLYLKGVAMEIDSYELYIVNNNQSTFEEFIKNYSDVYINNNPTSEALDFLIKLPENCVVYVDKNNIIQAITKPSDVSVISSVALYSFYQKVQNTEIIILLDEYDNDTNVATQKYIAWADKQTTNPNQKQYESISEINDNFEMNFFLVDNKNMLNDEFIKERIILFDDNLTLITHLNSDKNKYIIKQGYGVRDFVNNINYKYINQYIINNQPFNVYGKNQDELHIISFIKNGINIYMENDNPWTYPEIELIIKNF